MDVAEQAENEGEEQSEIPLSLDSSLEEVFGPGVTLLAKNLKIHSDKREELKTSDTEINSDSEVELVNASTPSKEQRKKRVRKNIKFGDLISINGINDNSGVSSEEEHSEEASMEVKKPRLLGGESNETHEEGIDADILGEENIIAEDKTNHSGERAEGIQGDKDNTEGFEEGIRRDKDNTEGFEEEDNVLKVLLDMHEDVPLEDPGPSEHGEERVSGATRLSVGEPSL